MTLRKRAIRDPGVFFLAVGLVAAIPDYLLDWLVPDSCTRFLGWFTDCPPPLSIAIAIASILYIVTALVMYLIGAGEWGILDLSRFKKNKK